MSRELIVLARKRAAQGRGLMAAKDKAAAHDASFKRILHGTPVPNCQITRWCW